MLTRTLVTVWLLLGHTPCRGAAEPARALPRGQLPADTRLGPLRGEQGDFSLVPATTRDQWKARAEHVRRILRVTLGLWPMPNRTPLHAVIHGRVDADGYTVQKVYFECLPGFYVTGNLYRPKGQTGKRPAVLSPHGHFPGGRLQDEGRDTVRQKIVQGAERFEDGGRSFMQSRCVQLARMGCVVFHYDMIGYGDSVQIPLEVAHRFSSLRAKFSHPPAHGFYSAQAELNLINPMGLHTYQSIRALDFLTSLPEVDPRRIAVTGGSGGGTQTFMLCAVDDRPLVSVPVVIVSTTRQGGCTCENISGLRIGTYNLEFTALHAPKPLLLISADDATRGMPERGFPELQQLYKTLGAEENVALVALLQFPHNYNYVSRAAMYRWLNRHLELGLDEPIVERPYRRLAARDLSVWNDQHPRPAVDSATEDNVIQCLVNDARRQMTTLIPDNCQSLQRYHQVVGAAWDILLRDLPPDPDIRFAATVSRNRSECQEMVGRLRYRTIEQHRAELPVVVLSPKKSGRPAARRAVVWIDGRGKSSLYGQDGSLIGPVKRLLDAGVTVWGADLLYQGEFLVDGRPIKRQRWLPHEEAFAGWTYCYNLPLLARRVHDILAVIALARQGGKPAGPVDLVGLGGGGPWAAAAVAQAHGLVTRAAIDTQGFRFAQLTDVYDVNFLPGAAKYGDLPGLLALAAPTPVWLAGEGGSAPATVSAAYQATGKKSNLTMFSGQSRDVAKAAVAWLLQP